MERVIIKGVELAYELRGRGMPLVMIHGAQGDQTMLANLAAALAGRFQVLSFDQRGSGLSDKPDMPYSMAMLADDTAALMEHVGWSAAHVLGVSMGGMIAQELALRHPRKVLALVLGCTSAGGRNGVRSEDNALAGAYSTRPLSAEERGAALARAVFTQDYVARHPEIITAMIEARRRRPIDPIALGHRMKALEAHDTYERLPRIGCPTLVITGKDDVLIQWENSRLLAERISGAELVLLEPAGHCFWLEQPDQARDAIGRFLEAAPSTVAG